MVKPGGTGSPRRAHFGEIGALAAEQIAQLGVAIGVLAKREDMPALAIGARLACHRSRPCNHSPLPYHDRCSRRDG